MSKSKFRDDLAFSLGGRTAEELIFGDVTTGAANDLERVTELARSMVTRYGMSESLGPMTFGQKEELVFLGKEIGEQRDYSEAVAQKIDTEVSAIVREAHDRASQVLQQHREQLDRIANELIEVETLDRDRFVGLFESADGGSGGPTDPSSASGESGRAAAADDRSHPTLDMPPAPAPA